MNSFGCGLTLAALCIGVPASWYLLTVGALGSGTAAALSMTAGIALSVVTLAGLGGGPLMAVWERGPTARAGALGIVAGIVSLLILGLSNNLSGPRLVADTPVWDGIDRAFLAGAGLSLLSGALAMFRPARWSGWVLVVAGVLDLALMAVATAAAAATGSVLRPLWVVVFLPPVLLLVIGWVTVRSAGGGSIDNDAA